VLKFAQSADVESVDELILQLNSSCSSLMKCRLSSLFLLNSTTFEFEQTGSHSSSSSMETLATFNGLLEAGSLAEVLMSGGSFRKQISNQEDVCLVPIKSKEMIFALLLMIVDRKVEYSEDSQLILSTLISIFSMKYFSFSSVSGKTVSDKDRTTSLLDQIENLKQSRADLHEILDSLHEGIFIVDKSSRQISDVNQTAVTLVGTSKESLLGKNKDDFFLFFDTTMFREEIITSEEALLINTNGITIPIIYTTTDIKLGNDDYQIVSFLDISERKMMEDKIQQSRFELEFIVEERTRELLNTNKELEEEIAKKELAQRENLKLISAVQQTESLIMITDLNSRIEYANPAQCRKTGYSLDELIGNKPSLLKSGDLTEKNYEYLWKKLIVGESCMFEFRNRKKNGELYWVASNILPIKDENGVAINYLSVQEDITERKNTELQMLAAKEKVEKAEKAKSSLLANMSHEFRTPLISILGFSELLEYDLTDKEQIEMVHAIQSGGKRLLNSLESVLLLSHLESSNLNFAMKKVNIIPLIHSSVKLFLSEAHKKFLDLNFETSLEEILVVAEEKYFSQTINHLVDNAIKYTASGEIRITLDYTIENNMDYILISIHDTGIGINEEDQRTIFEAFRQASEGYNRNYEGFGLGLTIAQKTIHLMNGKISVKSKPKEGSIFTIWLPFSAIK